LFVKNRLTNSELTKTVTKLVLLMNIHNRWFFHKLEN